MLKEVGKSELFLGLKCRAYLLRDVEVCTLFRLFIVKHIIMESVWQDTAFHLRVERELMHLWLLRLLCVKAEDCRNRHCH